MSRRLIDDSIDIVRNALGQANAALYPNIVQHSWAVSLTATAGVITLGYALWSLEWDLDSDFRSLPVVSTWGFIRYLLNGVPTSNHAVPPSPKGMYRIRLPMNQHFVDVTSPKLAREVLFNVDAFPKMATTSLPRRSIIRRLFGKQLANSNGEDWKHIRKVVSPPFHRQWHTDPFGSCVLELEDIIDQNGKSVDAHCVFQRLTLDVLGKAVLGFNFGALKDEKNKYVQTYNAVIDELFSFYTLFGYLDNLTPKRRRYSIKVDRMVNLLSSIIAEKRASLGNPDSIDVHTADLLTLMLLSNQAEDGLTDEELRYNLMVFFLAGHDTTSSSLTSELFYLAAYPDVQEKARQEVLGVMGDAPESLVPTLAQTKQVPYIDAIIRESMRLVPPAAKTSGREIKAPQTLNGVTLPKGTRVQVHIYHILQNKEIFGEDADQFNPDRFLGSSDVVKERIKNHLGFGDGARVCLGKGMSLVEQRVVLMMLLRKYRITLAHDSQCTKNHVVMTPAILSLRGVKLDFDRRF